MDNNYWTCKVSEIVHNPHICGICLDPNEEMNHVNVQFEIVLKEKTLNCSLKDIVKVVFREIKLLANTEICNNCTNKLIQSYIFTENAKKALQTLDYYLNLLSQKTFNYQDRYLKYCPKNDVLFSLQEQDDLRNNKKEESVKKDNFVKKSEKLIIDKFESSDDFEPQLHSKFEQDSSSDSADEIKVDKSKKGAVHSKPKRKKYIHLDCVVCEETFPTRHALVTHLKEHGPDTKYPCRTCNIEFDTLGKFRAHNRMHSIPKLICQLCGKKIQQCYIKKHMKTHKEITKQKICETCGKSFYSIHSLYYHKKTHLNSIKCPKCNKLINAARYKIHLQWHEIQADPVLRAAKKSKIQKKFKCELCDYRSVHGSNIDAHMNRYHLKVRPYVCDLCGKAFTGKALLKKHTVTHTIQHSVDCSICNKTLANPKCLQMHMRRHTNDNPYACEMCGERFVSSSLLDVHKIKKHTENKNYACPLCTSKFFTVRELRRHVKKVHWKNKEKKFDPRKLEGLGKEHYYLFQDGRRVKVNDEEIDFN